EQEGLGAVDEAWGRVLDPLPAAGSRVIDLGGPAAVGVAADQQHPPVDQLDHGSPGTRNLELAGLRPGRRGQRGERADDHQGRRRGRRGEGFQLPAWSRKVYLAEPWSMRTGTTAIRQAPCTIRS